MDTNVKNIKYIVMNVMNWMISDQIIFMDGAKFDPIFGDLTCFLQRNSKISLKLRWFSWVPATWVCPQNKNIDVNRIESEKSKSINISLNQNYEECMHWTARNQFFWWWVTPIFCSESNHTSKSNQATKYKVNSIP